MRSKYFLLASVLFMNLLLFSSCLNSSDENIEYSPDAQVYAFSLSSRADTANLLTATQFTIDQINGKIFNKEPLPYQFQVDSVLLNIRGQSAYSSFSQIMLTLEPDSSFVWTQSDSVAVNRLRKITTTAPDGKTTKAYNFELNVYQQDPYILSWEKRQNNYLTSAVVSQKTIALNNLFITYWLSSTVMQAVTTTASDGVNWSGADVTGLPYTADLSTLVVSGNVVYMLDSLSGSVYKSTDGLSWEPVTTPYSVKAMYGELPTTTGGKILIAVNHNDTLKFADTDDFSVMRLLNSVPEDIPVKDFTAAKIDNPTSYSIKYIILSGGARVDTAPNNDIWILQHKNGLITFIKSRVPASLSLNGSSLFFYDNKPYLMTTSSDKNILIYSENSGLDWIEAGQNQQFPADFNKRTAASVITDADNYIWIFGGVSATQTPLVDVWRGRLNKFAEI